MLEPTLSETMSASPLAFERMVPERARAAITWLERTIEAWEGQGSAASYSRFRRPIRGWDWPYPETTGYIIETLFAYADFARDSRYASIAMRQADWVMSLQAPDGALPGNAVRPGRVGKKSVFNTGQMILGLVAAWDRSGERRYRDSAVAAARWLADGVDERTGTWSEHAYVRGHTPAYYTRVAWPMLEVATRTDDQLVHSRARLVLDTIAGWQLANGAIRNWAFTPAAPAFTHTIAYTVRGFLESGRLLGPAGDRFGTAAYETADALRRRMETHGRLAGSYDDRLRGRYWFTCLTGNCQLAVIWNKLFERRKDVRFLSAAIKAMAPVLRAQRLRSWDTNLRGAIPGSTPVWGRYMAMRYPNWAAKFFVDALLGIGASLKTLRERGPCALR